MSRSRHAGTLTYTRLLEWMNIPYLREQYLQNFDEVYAIIPLVNEGLGVEARHEEIGALEECRGWRIGEQKLNNSEGRESHEHLKSSTNTAYAFAA